LAAKNYRVTAIHLVTAFFRERRARTENETPEIASIESDENVVGAE
jgi:hypothetical protein